ncbi:MAG: hypothetical protein GC181_10520 [Bacteroidetes bacterium]|nr:hypothetical protein [Bacteroidota bacterium]
MKIFRFDVEYLNVSDEQDAISHQTKKFIKRCESQSWLSWNYPELRAFKKLKSLGPPRVVSAPTHFLYKQPATSPQPPTVFCTPASGSLPIAIIR